MARVRILPEIVSNRIAAGEVVERPASVVKELVENALDAGAARVLVEVEKGGRSLIRVSDDGAGMPHDDALLALERYATSKLSADGDLHTIRTLGFRGEALPSIAAVSRLTLVSRPADAAAGTEIFVEGGRIRKVGEVGAPPGTLVTVRQLFFNTPARRKFLKSIGTEMGHIADTVAAMAMGRPGVFFRLVHNGRAVHSWPAAADTRARVAAMLDTGAAESLIAFEADDGELRISGWLAPPGVTRSTPRGLFIFINGRFVRDRLVQHALFEGCEGRIGRGRYPLGAVFLQLPSAQVDVNVHPTKREVRFVQGRRVHAAVAAALSRALRRAERPGWEPAEGKRYPTAHAAAVAEKRAPFAGDHLRGDMGRQASAADRFGLSEGGVFSGAAPRPALDAAERGGEGIGPAAADGGRMWAGDRFAALRVIGQLHNTYILCEGGDGLYLIDQHAAHERIVYEQLRRRAASRHPAVQPLLVPETVELGYAEAEALRGILPELEQLGLQIEPFGGGSFVVRALPAPLEGRAAGPLIVELAEKMAAHGAAVRAEEAIEQGLKLAACHAAVRGSQGLAPEELRQMLAQLDRCEDPSRCPHGRPTWVRWRLRDLQKAFGRIV